jgi:hypothetical protein
MMTEEKRLSELGEGGRGEERGRERERQREREREMI